MFKDFARLRVAFESQDGDFVDRIQRLNIVRRGKGSDSHHPIDVDAFGNERFTNTQLISCQSTSLVRAEDIDALYTIRRIHNRILQQKRAYSKRFDSSEFLDNGFLFRQVGSTNSQCCGGDDRQTDRDTDNQEDQDVMEQIVGAVLRGSNIQMMEESTNPGDKDPQDDNNQESRSNRVHDSFEVTLVFGTLNKSRCTTDERSPSIGSDDTISFPALASGGIVAGVAHVFVDSQRFTSNGRLVASDEGDTVVCVTIFVILVAFLLFWFLTFFFSHELLVFLEGFGVVVGADKAGISWYDLPFFDDDLD